MQFGIGQGRAGNAWARYGTGRRADVYKPEQAIPAAARKLCADGAPRRLDNALYAYNPSWAYVARVKRLARSYAGGRR